MDHILEIKLTWPQHERSKTVPHRLRGWRRVKARILSHKLLSQAAYHSGKLSDAHKALMVGQLTETEVENKVFRPILN